MVGEVVTPRYRQTSILEVEASDPAEGEGGYEVKPQTDQGKGICTTQMSVGDVEVWDISHENAPRTPIRPEP